MLTFANKGALEHFELILHDTMPENKYDLSSM